LISIIVSDRSYGLLRFSDSRLRDILGELTEFVRILSRQRTDQILFGLHSLLPDVGDWCFLPSLLSESLERSNMRCLRALVRPRFFATVSTVASTVLLSILIAFELKVGRKAIATPRYEDPELQFEMNSRTIQVVDEAMPVIVLVLSSR